MDDATSPRTSARDTGALVNDILASGPGVICCYRNIFQTSSLICIAGELKEKAGAKELDSIRIVRAKTEGNGVEV
jgi:hypothetical protein